MPFQVEMKIGPRSRFRDQEFWAEGGLICIENRNTGNFKAITRVEAAARAIALNDELQYMQYPDERNELSKCVVDLCEAIKEAKQQGDPTDPEVRKQRIKDSRKVSMLTGRQSDSPTPPPSIILGNSFTPLQNSDRFRKLKL